jgi:glycosyltransferase involved in cell wall biosynthesis
LTLAGNRDENSAYWKNEIAPHLGRNGISYIGPVNDLQKNELLGRAGALLVPIGWEEPFGLVFTEALACGTPVISFRRGALPEIVEHGRHGFLCDDPSELPASIKKIHLIDRAACRRRIEERFTSALMFARYENLYHRLAPAP